MAQEFEKERLKGTRKSVCVYAQLRCRVRAHGRYMVKVGLTLWQSAGKTQLGELSKAWWLGLFPAPLRPFRVK